MADSDDKSEDKYAFFIQLTKSVLIFAGVCAVVSMIFGYNFNTCVYMAGGMKLCFMAAKHALKLWELP